MEVLGPSSVIQERSARMLALARRLARDFHQRFIGQELQVLFENLAGENTWQGLTDNYIRVWVRTERDLHNTIAWVRAFAADEEGLQAILQESV